MHLSDWLNRNGVTQQAFGERIGLTQGRISQICLHGTDSIRVAKAIERATDGAVPMAHVTQAEAAE